MKILIVFLLLLFCVPCNAQRFVRIYDKDHYMVGKGRMIAVNDTVLKMKNNVDGYFSVPIKKVVLIVTGKSGGPNIVIGAISGAAIGTLIGALSDVSHEVVTGDSRGHAGVGFLIG